MTTESPRKRRIVPFLLCFLFVGPCGCCVGWSLWEQATNSYYMQRLKVQLDEGLPDGTTWEECEAWFRSNNIGYHIMLKTIDGPMTGLRATIPNSLFLDGGEIRIELYFDADRRLKKREIYRFAVSM